MRIFGLGLGPDPVSPDFGARVFDAGSGGHSDYLAPARRPCATSPTSHSGMSPR